jgi:hypothetical protein
MNAVYGQGRGVSNRTRGVVMVEIHNPKRLGEIVVGCLFALMALTIMIAGCASQGTMPATMQTQLDLGSCGFTWKTADTPEKLKQVEALPQRQIVRHEKDGKAYYIYADARDCKCVYIGDEKAYQQYKQFVYDKRMDRKNDLAAEQTAIMSVDPNFWSIFGHGPEN